MTGYISKIKNFIYRFLNQCSGASVNKIPVSQISVNKTQYIKSCMHTKNIINRFIGIMITFSIDMGKANSVSCKDLHVMHFFVVVAKCLS